LDGTASGKTLDIGPIIYNLTLNGSGGEWTVVNHPIWIEGTAALNAGSLKLGAGLTHTVGYLTSAGAALDFGGSTLRMLYGSADLSGLGAMTAGTGALQFISTTATQNLTPKTGATYPSISHTGTTSLRLLGTTLSCASFSQTGGNLDFNGQDLTTVSGGDFILTNGNSGSFAGMGGRLVKVAGNASLSGQSGNLANMNPITDWTLAVTGSLNANYVNLTHCAATVSAGTAINSADGGGNTNWGFAVTWTGAGGNANWSNPANWGGGAVPTATNDVRFDATSVQNVTLDVDGSARSISFAAGYTGTVSFSSHTLSLYAGLSDFMGGETLSAGTGALAFLGAATKYLAPKPGAVFPALIQNGTGTTGIASNPIVAGDLTITAGTFNLGTAMTQTFNNVSGTGTLDFNTSHLSAKGDVDLSALTVATSGTNLILSGTVPQTYKPNASVTNLGLIQSGTGGATIASNGFTVPSLSLSAGTLNLGVGLTHNIASTFTMTGGTLDFGSSTLRFAGATLDFALLGAMNAGTGALEFTGGSSQTFIPKASTVYPDVLQTGAGGTTISTNPLLAGNLTISGGTLHLGSSLAHVFTSVTATAGGLDFGSSTLEVKTGNANLANLGTLTAGSGQLLFTAASGVQTFSPKLGATHPQINHSASGTLMLGANNLTCAAFKQQSGLFDFNGFNVNVAGAGEFSILNGGSGSLANLGGRTIIVGGKATLLGQPANHLNLNPASGWTLTVTGTLKATNADIRNSLASLSTGQADSSSNLLGNTNWTFLDSIKPDNVTAFTATAIGPSVITLAWAKSVSADADTTMLRYRTDGTYPANTKDGTLWKKVRTSVVGDTATGLLTNTVYAFAAFVRDSSGNYSATAIGAKDTALYQNAVTGTVVINDAGGMTKNPGPNLAFTYSGADSMRFSLLADTALAAWKPLRASDSMSLAAGADGSRIILAQFKNVFGTRSPWVRDTTILDRIAPVPSLNLVASYTYKNWPEALTGKAPDALTGTDTIYVMRMRESDGAYYNGSTWVAAADTARLRSDSVFTVPMPSAALLTGDYQFSVFAKDKAGNASALLSMRVHYDENRAPVLASSTVPDTSLQNQAVALTVDLGDEDAGDSVLTVTSSIPPWLTLTEKPDTAAGGFAAHRIYTLAGKPGQPQVGLNTLTIQARDLGGKTVTFAKTLIIKDVNDPPVFTAGQDTLGVKEDSVTRWIPKYTDLDSKDAHTLALLAGPAWASLQDSAVVFHPGSRDVGKATLRLTVSDGQALDTLDMSVTAINVNDAPVAFPYANWQSPAHWKEHQVDTFTVVVVDMDKGDPITLATALPPFITYVFAVDSANPYNRFFKFTVLPRQQDSGSFSLKLRFTDQAGAASELALQAKVQPVNDPPTAIIKDNLVNAGAAHFNLDVTDADGTLAQTRFHYRLVSAAGDTVKRGISASPLLTLNPIADGRYTLAVMAEDEGGLKQSGFTTASITVSGASTLALDSARWNMAGTPGAALPAAALGAGAAITSWDETSDDGQALGRYAAGKSADSLKRGKGYWIKVAKRVNLSIAQKDLLDRPLSIKLTHSKQGWNQIGNPFPYYVDLSESHLQFWEWDADRRDLINTKGLLKPWGAYWVQVAKDTILNIKDEPFFPAPSNALAKSGSLAPGFRSAGDWSLQLALQAGPYQDQINFLGVRAHAGGATVQAGVASTQASVSESVSNPEFISADAPKFGDYIALHFEKPDQALAGDSTADDNGFAADFRDHLGADEEWWDFTVENSGSGYTQASLKLPGLEPLLASGLNAFLVRRGEAMPLKAGEPAVLAMEGAATHYSLVITPHADFAQMLKGNFNVSQNFPNPVLNQTTFRFFLPQTWDASGKRESKAFRLRLNLYDYSGRLAAQVVQGDFKAGSHTLAWKPQAKNGRDLAKGAYIYRLEIPGFTQSLKLLIR